MSGLKNGRCSECMLEWAQKEEEQNLRARMSSERNAKHVERITTLEADLADARKQIEAEAAKRAEVERDFARLRSAARALVEASRAYLGSQRAADTHKRVAAEFVESFKVMAALLAALDSGGGEGEKASETQADRVTRKGTDEAAVSDSSPAEAPKSRALFTPEMAASITKISFRAPAFGPGRFVCMLASDPFLVFHEENNESLGDAELFDTVEEAIHRAYELSCAKPSPPRTEGR